MIVSRAKEIMESKKVTLRGMMEGTGLANETILRARGKEIRQCKLCTLEIIAEYLGVKTKDLYDED